ncbi:hypothetical protein TL16_g12344 [Triparma laevis f. inornata]|uniref:NAD(P)-binding domain-containing protein n=1 Tax=Triparma laevis f. inornata TaxID=1714386 RepID=A0A9W7BRJ3_9STRA|nr:hypothetical protein TL16_g12344 [Triparma laevis f. inornata]
MRISMHRPSLLLVLLCLLNLPIISPFLHPPLFPQPAPPPSSLYPLKRSLSLPNPYKLGRYTRKILTSPIYLDGLSPPPSSDLSSPERSRSPTSSKPTILIIGSTGTLGLQIIRRLTLSSSYNLKVLVRDIYSSTVDNLGSSVAYSFGDVRNVGEMGVGVTDVDKVVYVAASVEKDEEREKEECEVLGEGEFVGVVSYWSSRLGFGFIRSNKYERIYVHWRSLPRTTGLLQRRKLIKNEKVIFKIGDKRKFKDNTLFNKVTNGGRFNGESIEVASGIRPIIKKESSSKTVNYIGLQNVLRSLQDVRYVDYGESSKVSMFRFKKSLNSDVGKWAVSGKSMKWCDWKQNRSLNGVWRGEGKRGFEVKLLSGRLSSRSLGSTNAGVDLTLFNGILTKMCGDGSEYNFVVKQGGEEFRRKLFTRVGEKGRGKFENYRVRFEEFRNEKGDVLVPTNVTQVGFSYSEGCSFYLSISYIKLLKKELRQTPEIIFVSDGRLPVNITGDMVNDGLELIEDGGGSGSELFDEEEEGKGIRERKRERYWKWKGEQSLKSSG